MNLTKITRSTRGKGTRPVTFDGLVVEVQAVDKDGKPEFTNPRDKDATPEPVMTAVDPSTLPHVDEILSGILVSLGNSIGAFTLTIAKTFNAVQFAKEVAATATIVEDLLSPVFAELGISDEAVVTKLRRAVSTAYTSAVDMGFIPKDQSNEDQAAAKIKTLRAIVAQYRG